MLIAIYIYIMKLYPTTVIKIKCFLKIQRNEPFAVDITKMVRDKLVKSLNPSFTIFL